MTIWCMNGDMHLRSWTSLLWRSETSALGCRCPQESGALFLYRKLEKVPEPVLLAAPPVKVTDEEAEEFIKTFNETLESVDPETIAKAAAPAEGEEPAGEHQSPLVMTA